MQLRNLVLLSVIVAAPAFVHAQPLKPAEWQTYTSMRSVIDIAVSSDSAHAWAVTGGGAFQVDLRYTQSTPIALRTTNGLTENDLTAVAADDSGNIYFGGGTGGFDVYHTATNSIEQLGADIRAANDPDKSIHSITVAGDKIYLATGYGISVYLTEPKVFGASVRTIAGLPFEDSVRQAIDDGTFVYGAMSEGVVFARNTADLQNGHNWTLIRDTGGAVRSLVLFQGKVYAGAENGLFAIASSRQSFDSIPFPIRLAINRLIASADSLYILDDAGTVYSTHDLVNFTSQNLSATTGSTVVAIARAPYAGLVTGSASTGVGFSVAGQFVASIFPLGPLTNNINFVHFATATDQLYVTNGKLGFGIFQPATDTWQDFQSGTGTTPNANYTKVLYDSIRNVTWLSNYGSPLYNVRLLGSSAPVWNTIDHTQIPNAVGDTNNYIVSSGMMIDRDSNIIVTSWAFSGKGISISRDGEHFMSYTLAPGDFETWGCVTQDLNGNYWVGTEEHNDPKPKGVSWLRASDHATGIIPGGSSGTLGTPIEGTEIVNAVLTDQDDGIWCGTEGGVEIISNPDAILDVSGNQNPSFSIRSVPFVAAQVVRTMAVDGVGNKWIGTDDGIFVVSPDGSDSVARFTKENSPLVDDRVQSIAIDPTRGEAYAATPSGISRFSTIFKQGESDYSSIRVYPNPVVQTAEESPTVYIDGLVAGSTVQIFSLAGRLITTINGTALGSTVTWNGRDALGRQVPSGLYLVSATSPQSGENGAAKVVIVRRPSN